MATLFPLNNSTIFPTKTNTLSSRLDLGYQSKAVDTLYQGLRPKKPDPLASPSSYKQNNAPFLALCSTKPETHIGENLTVEPVSKPGSHSESLKGLVFGLGTKGSWDSAEIGSPVVKRFLSDDQERWLMWYYGKSDTNLGGDSIGIAISGNGIHWERGDEGSGTSSGLGRVFGPGENWWAFDTKGVRPSEVVVMSSSKLRPYNAVYWLYYTGFNPEVVEIPTGFNFLLKDRVLRSLPGLAVSQDGRNWARIEGEHESGALFGEGSEGEWDSFFSGSPHVVTHSKGDMRMYYHSLDEGSGKWTVGIARSRDGLKWEKLGKIDVGGRRDSFDGLGFVNACVVWNKRSQMYLMAYEGVGPGGKRSIGLAQSEDGLTEWERLGDGPILEASVEGGWDSIGVGSPCLVEMDGNGGGEWRLYYRGLGHGGRTGIGMAVCNENEIGRFKRWVGFRV